MSEGEWLVSEDSKAMMAFLTQSSFGPAGLARETAGIFPPSDRKFRLFACACVRLCGTLLVAGTTCQLDAVEGLEGQVSEADYLAIHPLLIPPVSRLASHHASLPDRRSGKSNLFRCIVGNPFRPHLFHRNPDVGIFDCEWCDELWSWRTPTVLRLARSCYEVRNADGTLDEPTLAVLSDALEDAGCDDEELLMHLRGREGPCPYRGALAHPLACHWCGGKTWRPLAGSHVRGCWVIDLLLGKE